MKKLTNILLLLLITPAIVFGGDILTKTLAADYVVNNDASLNQTDLQVTVATAGTYDIKISVHSASDVKALRTMLSGSATVDAFLVQYTCSDALDSSISFAARRTLSPGPVSLPSALDGRDVFCQISGSVEFSSTGTFILYACQTTPDISDTTMFKGSTMVLIQTD